MEMCLLCLNWRLKLNKEVFNGATCARGGMQTLQMICQLQNI